MIKFNFLTEIEIEENFAENVEIKQNLEKMGVDTYVEITQKAYERGLQK